MIYAIVTSIVVLAAAIIAFLVMKKKAKSPGELTIRRAITDAKQALQDQEQPPYLYRLLKDRTEQPFVAATDNKSKTEMPGTFHFRFPELEIVYSYKDNGSEKIILKHAGRPDSVALFYNEGILNAIRRNKTALDAESFEMRQAGTIADHLRNFVRCHLRFPGGTLEIDKAAEPTFKPVLDLNKGGDIKLKGQPPPGRQPHFDKD